MDVSRFNTLSLNNTTDIVANSIRLIQGNTTYNIIDLFALKTNYVNSITLIGNTYNKIETDNLLN